MRALVPRYVGELVLLGAHCDDIVLGAGGLLLNLCAANPGVSVHAVVLTGGGCERAAEEQRALRACCPAAELDLTVLDLPDGRLPGCWEEIKEALESLRQRSEPDLIVAPALHDAHQDHRQLAGIVSTAFRDHLVLGYEIVKWDGDLAQPQVYHPVPEVVLRKKIALLHEHYPSQRQRSWFDSETLRGLARIRGVQCQSRYAEAFHVAKIVLDTGKE